MYKFIMDLTPNDWKHITEFSQKSLLKTFCYNKGTKKVKDFKSPSNKEILEQTFQIYISWPNVMDGRKPHSQS